MAADQPPRLELLSGWGRQPRSAAHVVEAAALLERWLGDPPPRGLLPRGLGRSYGDAALNAGGVVGDMTTHGGIIDLDLPGNTVRVRAGTSLHELMLALVPLGRFLPVTPGTRYVTVGGAIACDIHGKSHHRDGGFAQHVVGFELVTPTGDRRTVDPDDDPDVFWATAGGMGLTGVITEATLRLLPIETALVRVDTERCADLDDAMARMVDRDDDYRYSVAWIDLMARGRALGRSVLTRGDHAARDELPARRRADPLAFHPHHLVRTPGWTPSGLLGRRNIRAFNELWFRKAPQRETAKLQGFGPFFHPLDGVGDWNRLYGERGFLQYQFVVPDGEEETLRRIVEQVAAHQYPSFLAVLKRMGEQPGFLSFPMRGWTLALDVPLGVTDLAELLDECDRRVAAAGGRVYLAKDSRMPAPAFRDMYPRFAEWRKIRDWLDPDGVMRSDLARRLELLDK